MIPFAKDIYHLNGMGIYTFLKYAPDGNALRLYALALRHAHSAHSQRSGIMTMRMHVTALQYQRTLWRWYLKPECHLSVMYCITLSAHLCIYLNVSVTQNIKFIDINTFLHLYIASH